MTLENKGNHKALILRIAAVFVLTVMILVAAFVGPKYTASDPTINIQNTNEFENTNNHNPSYNSEYDVTLLSLDQTQLSNYKYWMKKHGTSKCHYHNAIYHLGTDCSLQQCYTDDTTNPTFDNQLIIEGKVWTKPFIQQMYNINSSILNYITNNNITLYPTRIDLSATRGKHNKYKIIKRWNVEIYWIHMALEYFCCYTSDEYNTIIKAMRKFEFKAFEIEFDKFLCIGESRINIVLFADAESQQYLSRLTDKIEEYLRDGYNISIHSHRRDAQPFHVTLLSIDTDIDAENEQDAMQIVKYLNDNYKWQDIKIKIDKSFVCMNDKGNYDVEYTCF